MDMWRMVAKRHQPEHVKRGEETEKLIEKGSIRQAGRLLTVEVNPISGHGGEGINPVLRYAFHVHQQP